MKDKDEEKKGTFSSYIRFDENDKPYLSEDAPPHIKKLYKEYFISDEEEAE